MLVSTAIYPSPKCTLGNLQYYLVLTRLCGVYLTKFYRSRPTFHSRLDPCLSERPEMRHARRNPSRVRMIEKYAAVRARSIFCALQSLKYDRNRECSARQHTNAQVLGLTGTRGLFEGKTLCPSGAELRLSHSLDQPRRYRARYPECDARSRDYAGHRPRGTRRSVNASRQHLKRRLVSGELTGPTAGRDRRLLLYGAYSALPCTRTDEILPQLWRRRHPQGTSGR